MPTYTVPDHPADPEAAALELIVQIPADVLGHNSPPRDALQDFASLLHAYVFGSKALLVVGLNPMSPCDNWPTSTRRQTLQSRTGEAGPDFRTVLRAPTTSQRAN